MLYVLESAFGHFKAAYIYIYRTTHIHLPHIPETHKETLYFFSPARARMI